MQIPNLPRRSLVAAFVASFAAALLLPTVLLPVRAARSQDGTAPALPNLEPPPLSTPSDLASVGEPTPPAPDAAPRGKREIHRLRIVNRKDGAIQISGDGGQTWKLLGRVLIPANTVAEGYLAAHYSNHGSIAAIAVHGIRIRISANDKMLHAPLLLAIEPKEYAQYALKERSKQFGGHRAGSAGIYTDIPSGTSLFRELSPLVGNRVFLESPNGRLIPIPPTYRPMNEDEVFIIPVHAPVNSLTAVTFENKPGGKVMGTFADGTTRQLTQVVKPVFGTGRFDGTAYTGVGRINTAHSGVITVSTAPVDNLVPENEGKKDRRGGFQISPAWHNARCAEAGAPMVMTLGTPGPRKRELEGVAPLFRDNMWLGPGEKATQAGIANVRIDNGAWEPMPTLIGRHLDAFTVAGLNRYFKAMGIDRKCVQGVTHFRLRLPQLEAERSRIVAGRASQEYQTRRWNVARSGKEQVVGGVLTINTNPSPGSPISFVRLSVEGSPRGLTNVAPYTLSWDTTKVTNGEYLIECEALDQSGAVVSAVRKKVYVWNKSAARTQQASAANGGDAPQVVTQPGG